MGWVFATFSVSMTFGSCLVGKYLAQFGRRNMLLLGITIQVISNFSYAMSFLIDGKNWYYLALIFTIRFAEGFANGCILTTAIAILTITFPKYNSLMVSIIETAYGVGSMLGPLLGSILYSVGGF